MTDYKFTPDERQMFADFYHLCQKHWIVQDSDEYWNAVIDATDDFTAKYHQLHPMVVTLAAGVVSGLEAKSKMGKEKKDG